MASTAKSVIAYASGIFLILLGIVGLLLSWLGGAILVLTGLFAFPAVRQRLAEDRKISLSTNVVFWLVIAGLLAGTIVIGIQAPTGGSVDDGADDPAGAQAAGGQPTTPSATEPTATRTVTSAPTPTTTSTPTSTTTPTPSATPSLEDGVTVTVIEVIDGDTMEVRFPDGRTETIRLLGVDTPEVHVATDPAEWEGVASTQDGRDWLRDWGHKSSEFARAEIGNAKVTIQTDPQTDHRGGYGRLLVYVFHDGDLFNRELLVQGYARLYDTRFSKRSTFASAETTARSNDIGVWGYEPPSTSTPDDGDGSATPSALAVTEIHEDAEGNDHENLNDEYIVFTNTGDGTLDISGWTISDEADHMYTVPSGVTLEPGETVTLYTGSGTDSDTELYWGSGSAIWNNGGDTIIVTTDTGETVLERSYS